MSSECQWVTSLEAGPLAGANLCKMRTTSATPVCWWSSTPPRSWIFLASMAQTDRSPTPQPIVWESPASFRNMETSHRPSLCVPMGLGSLRRVSCILLGSRRSSCFMFTESWRAILPTTSQRSPATKGADWIYWFAIWTFRLCPCSIHIRDVKSRIHYRNMGWYSLKGITSKVRLLLKIHFF